MLTQLLQQLLDASCRLSAQRLARGRAFADEIEPVACSGPVRGKPGIGRTRGIRAVENDAAETIRMPRREHLADERAVAVTVVVDVVDAERVHHGDDVIDCEVRAVERSLWSEFLR